MIRTSHYCRVTCSRAAAQRVLLLRPRLRLDVLRQTNEGESVTLALLCRSRRAVERVRRVALG